MDIDVERLWTEPAASEEVLALVCVEAQGLDALDHSVEEETCLR